MKKYIKNTLILIIVLIFSCDLEVEANESDLSKPNKVSQIAAVTNGVMASFSAAYDELAAMDGIYTDQYDASQGYSYMQEIEDKIVGNKNVMTLSSWKNLLLALDGLEIIKEATASNFSDRNNYRFIYHFLYANWLEVVARYYESVPKVGTEDMYTIKQAREEALVHLEAAIALKYTPSVTMISAVGFSLTASNAIKTVNTVKARIQVQLGQNASSSLAAGLTLTDESLNWVYASGSSVGIYQYINATSPTYLDIQKNGSIGKGITKDSLYSELFSKYAEWRGTTSDSRWKLNYFQQYGTISLVSGIENELLKIETGTDLNTRKNQLGTVLISLGLSPAGRDAVLAKIVDDAGLMIHLSVVQGIGLIGQGQRLPFLFRRGTETANTWKLPNSFNF